ncbi:MAG: GNAT family N-acetyltransferase [Victivallales bacterium]|jgi:RimJ/RimL family protein N-acetyltransferase
MKEKIEIITERFKVRTLTEEDVTVRYLDWFDDYDIRRFIVTSGTISDIKELRAYVREKTGREDVIFLGIFEKDTGLHIGNIKFEPVNYEMGYAVMGILIGDSSYRGKGVASEILLACALWLKKQKNIKQMILGVSEDNIGAIRAYKKAGFVEAVTEFLFLQKSEGITMVWSI